MYLSIYEPYKLWYKTNYLALTEHEQIESWLIVLIKLGFLSMIVRL